jgi:hypothetical protein
MDMMMLLIAVLPTLSLLAIVIIQEREISTLASIQRRYETEMLRIIVKQIHNETEEEDGGWHSNNRRNVYSCIHGWGSVYPDGHIEYPDGTIKRKKEDED